MRKKLTLIAFSLFLAFTGLAQSRGSLDICRGADLNVSLRKKTLS